MTKQTQSEVSAEALELAIKLADWETKSFMREVRGRRSPQSAAHATAPPPDGGPQSPSTAQ